MFSLDVKYVAVISEDGCLRAIHSMADRWVPFSEPLGKTLTLLFSRLVGCYASYFGALTAVAWSPDGRFILVGWWALIRNRIALASTRPADKTT